MDIEIHLLPRARADLRNAFVWYEKKDLGLGDRFLEEIDGTLEKITRRPLSFALRFGPYRQALVESFPYSLYFKVEGGKAVVAYVFHTSLNPERLKGRLER